MAHPSYVHGLRCRVLRELDEVLHTRVRFSIEEAAMLTEIVRAKRAELVALVRTIEGIKLAGMTDTEIQAYLGLRRSSCDVVIH
jgi:hypothetical protein